MTQPVIGWCDVVIIWMVACSKRKAAIHFFVDDCAARLLVMPEMLHLHSLMIDSGLCFFEMI